MWEEHTKAIGQPAGDEHMETIGQPAVCILRVSLGHQIRCCASLLTGPSCWPSFYIEERS